MKAPVRRGAAAGRGRRLAARRGRLGGDGLDPRDRVLRFADGVLVYQTGGLASTQLLWFDRAGHDLGPAGPPGAYAEPALSPDGRSLALTLGEPETGRVGIWVMGLERKSLAPVAVSSLWSVNATPLWSPDGGASSTDVSGRRRLPKGGARG